MGSKQQYLIRVCIGLGAFFFAVVFTLLASLDASASNSSDCTTNSGSWSGSDPEVGTCVYPANSSAANLACGAPNYEYTIIYYASETTQDYCTFVAASTTTTSSAPEQGGCRSEVRGPLETRITLALCHNRNGAATFPVGGCYIKCTITADLPNAADRKMPGDSYATIYVRSVAPSGQPGTDSYAVCFNLGDLGLNMPTIYRFVSGSWEAVAIGNPASKVLCATGTGDGAFYLGHPNTKKNDG